MNPHASSRGMRWIVGLVAVGSAFLSGCILPAEPTTYTYSWPMAAPAPFLDALGPPSLGPGLLVDQMMVGTEEWDTPEALVITRAASGDPAWERVMNKSAGFEPRVQARLETLDYETYFAVAIFGLDSNCGPDPQIEFLRARIIDSQYVLEYQIPPRYVPSSSRQASEESGAAPCMVACTVRGIVVVDRFLPGPVEVIVEERDGPVRFLANEATT